MRKIGVKTKLGTAAVAAAVALGGGLAFAYWTTGGTGSGTGQTGSAKGVTITAAPIVSIVPNGIPEALSIVVHNPNSYDVSLEGKSITLDSATCGTDTTNHAAWFDVFVLGPGTFPALVFGPGDSPEMTGMVGISMINTADDQNICQNAVVHLGFTVS